MAIDDQNYLSRSQKKRNSTNLQLYGEKLAKYSEKELNDMELPEELIDAVIQFKKITKFAAKKRQAQYIGTLMRSVDNVDTIISYIENDQSKHQAIKKYHKFIENLRTQLLNPDEEERNKAIKNIVSSEEKIDQERLVDLIQQALMEINYKKPPHYFRQLFKYLEENISSKII